MCTCVYVFVFQFQCWRARLSGGVCVGVSVPCVFQPSGVYRHTCLFAFSVFTLASLMLSSYSLAATGQLINQIFKQCFSAQWVVLDYLWQLAVHGASHYKPRLWLASSQGVSCSLSLFFLSLLLALGLCSVFAHSFIISFSLIFCHSLSVPMFFFFLVCRSLSTHTPMYNCGFSEWLSDSEQGPLKSSHLSIFACFSLSAFFLGISLPVSPQRSPLWITI